MTAPDNQQTARVLFRLVNMLYNEWGDDVEVLRDYNVSEADTVEHCMGIMVGRSKEFVSALLNSETEMMKLWTENE